MKPPRIQLTATCESCDRSTKCSALQSLHLFRGGLVFSDFRFSPLPNGKASGWRETEDGVVCPEHKTEKADPA